MPNRPFQRLLIVALAAMMVYAIPAETTYVTYADRWTASSNTVGCPAGSRQLRPRDDLRHLIRTAGRGASLCFKKGVYRISNALQPLARQVWTFEPGAVLTGARVITRWTSDGNHWVTGGQTQSFSPEPWMSQLCTDRPSVCIFEDVYMDDRPLEHVTSLNSLSPGRVYFDRDSDRIYVADDPARHTIEATVAGAAIASWADNVTIRGASIEKFAINGINTAGDSWTIRDSNIHHVHFQAIGIFESSGHLLQNNRIHHSGIIGMTGAGLRNVVIKRNEFDHNNFLNAGPPSGGFHEGAVKILRSHDVVFRGNWSHHNDGDGLWFDTDNYDVRIENNLLESNTRNGLQYEASFGAIVRHNTIRNNGTDRSSEPSGILNSTSKNVVYYANRIANNNIRDFVLVWQDRGTSASHGERQSANVLFRNNLVIFDANPQSWVGVYWNQDERIFSSNNRFRGNTYYAQRDGDSWWLWRDHLTWREWRSIGHDRNGSFRQASRPRQPNVPAGCNFPVCTAPA